MRLLSSIPAFLAAAAALTAGASAAAPDSHATTAAMVPERQFECVLGRATNLDPHKLQTIADIRYEGAHQFALVLPPVPADRGPLPDPSADPEPVDPGVRILSDPDGLARDMTEFFRVVDLWPDRVEMAGRIAGETSVRLIILSEIDPDKSTANLFMTRAADAASLDLNRVYQGSCKVIAQARFGTNRPS